MPPSRCRVTMPGFSSSVTVNLPSIACTSSNSSRPVPSQCASLPGSRWPGTERNRLRHAISAIDRMSSPSAPAR